MIILGTPPAVAGATPYFTGAEAPATGVVNGVNKVFTFTHTPKDIVEDGVTYIAGQGYTWSAPTATMDIAPQGFIYSEY